MKFEILLVDQINEKQTGMTCFEAPDYIRKGIANCKPIEGIVLIDGVAVKFAFSPAGMDGDIYSGNDNHRRFVKYIIPIYVYNVIVPR